MAAWGAAGPVDILALFHVASWNKVRSVPDALEVYVHNLWITDIADTQLSLVSLTKTFSL